MIHAFLDFTAIIEQGTEYLRIHVHVAHVHKKLLEGKKTGSFTGT